MIGRKRRRRRLTLTNILSKRPKDNNKRQLWKKKKGTKNSWDERHGYHDNTKGLSDFFSTFLAFIYLLILVNERTK